MAAKKGEEKKYPRPGTVVVDGKAVKALRTKQGLTRDELADKSGVSLGTIDKLEAGGPVYPSSLHAVAQALGSSYDDLRAPGVVGVAYDLPGIKLTGVDVIKSGSLDQFDQVAELEELIEKLRAIIGAKYPIIVIHVSEGSIVLSLEMHHTDVGPLVIAFANKKLDVLGVTTIVIPNTVNLEEALTADVLRLRNVLRGRYLTYWFSIAFTMYARRRFIQASFGMTPQTAGLLSLLVRRKPQTVTLMGTIDYRVILERIGQ